MRLDRNPNDMAPEERVHELREIFAHGIVRTVLISGMMPGQPALTASAQQSDECAPPNPRG